MKSLTPPSLLCVLGFTLTPLITCLDPPASPCPGQVRPVSDSLSELITVARTLIKPGINPICIMEVGTGDGSGTTVSLFNTMLMSCRNESEHRDFRIHTYEGLPSLAQRAVKFWEGERRVTVVNELAILDDTIAKHILPLVTSLSNLDFPGRGFYIHFYNNHNNKVAKGIYGKHLKTLPNCTLDLVLLDGARFSHIGVIHTLLSMGNLTSPNTVYLVENDHWTEPYNGDQIGVLNTTWSLTDVHRSTPSGQMWPWAAFKIQS